MTSNYFENHILPLATQFNNGEAIAHIWTIEDVMSWDETLTRDDAIEVLQIVHDNLDSNIGINWDEIDNAIQFMKQDQQEPIFQGGK